MSDLQNPRKWRYTWETLSHIPSLRLFIFNPQIKPATQCKNLTVQLKFEESLLLISWNEETTHSRGVLLRVPVPKVLVELDSPVDFRATENHIEVKLVLLLPINHPLVLNFSSVFNSPDEGSSTECLEKFQSLSINSDIKSLLSFSRNGVDFYCKGCSIKLTKRPLRSFLEMPSVDWREVADNWFGSCCCSFGGISEKLVTMYANSYTSAEGTCLYDSTCVIVSKDDLATYVFPDSLEGNKKHGRGNEVADPGSFTASSGDDKRLCYGTETDRSCNGDDKLRCIPPPKKDFIVADLEDNAIRRKDCTDTSRCVSPSISNISGDAAHGHGFSAEDHSRSCISKTNYVPKDCDVGCSHDDSRISLGGHKCINNTELLRNPNSELSASVGNGFMVRTSNLSKDVKWIDFRCTQCSCILGAYPSMHGTHAPLDGGVRFFKCYIASDIPAGAAGDVFRNHSLQRMFTNQLIENANDELSFRTVVRDLRTNCPKLQIVLLNSDAWSFSDSCLETEGSLKPRSKIVLHPVVKVLFSDASNTAEAQSRIVEEWATKNQAHEIYMLTHQIEELIESLKSAQEKLPFSHSFMPGLSLSFLER